MSSSPFMDKQIMGLSGAGTGSGSGSGGSPGTSGGGLEFFDLMSHQKEDRQPESEEQILPSYDFQPVRSLGSSSPAAGGGGGAKLSWEPADSNNAGGSTLKYTSMLEPRELAKVSHEKEKGSYDAVTVAEIDRTVKKYADNLMYALEGVSSRLLQLENRTCHLESSLDDLMLSVGNNGGSVDGKLRQLENMLREVQITVQVVRDKLDITETRMQLSNLQTLKTENVPTDLINNEQRDSKQQALSSPMLPIQPVQQSVVPPPHPPPPPPTVPPLPSPNALPAPQFSNLPPVQFPSQPVQSQVSLPAGTRESYFSPPTQPADAATHQQFHMPPPQLPQQRPQVQQYSSPPQLPQYSQPIPHAPLPLNQSSQLQPPLPHLPEESVTYMPPPQSFPPIIRPSPPLNQPPHGSPPRQFYGPNSGIYEAPSNRPISGQHSFSGYGTSVVPNYPDSHSYTGSPSHYATSTKPTPLPTSGPLSGGSGSYPRLPTAQILPQAQPTGSSFGSSANRVPVDDIVDKVTLMGFPRDQVRASVRKLTENGQSVDLNVVLDKLMNDGEIQPQKGWFGR